MEKEPCYHTPSWSSACDKSSPSQIFLSFNVGLMNVGLVIMIIIITITIMLRLYFFLVLLLLHSVWRLLWSDYKKPCRHAPPSRTDCVRISSHTHVSLLSWFDRCQWPREARFIIRGVSPLHKSRQTFSASVGCYTETLQSWKFDNISGNSLNVSVISR